MQLGTKKLKFFPLNQAACLKAQSTDLEFRLFLPCHNFSIHLFIPALSVPTSSAPWPLWPLFTLLQAHQLPMAFVLAAPQGASVHCPSSSAIWHSVFCLFDRWLSLLLECKRHASRGVHACVCVLLNNRSIIGVIQCYISSLRTMPST